MNYIIIKALVLKAHICTKSAKSNPKSPKSFNNGDIQGRTLWREKSEKENEKKKDAGFRDSNPGPSTLRVGNYSTERLQQFDYHVPKQLFISELHGDSTVGRSSPNTANIIHYTPLRVINFLGIFLNHRLYISNNN